MQKVIFNLFLVAILSSCKQKDFVERKVLFNTHQDSLFYDIYQTGIDNYTFSFYNSYKGDTIMLFDYYVNDAVYTALRLTTTLNNDTIRTTANMGADDESYKLPSGSIFIFSGVK